MEVGHPGQGFSTSKMRDKVIIPRSILSNYYDGLPHRVDFSERCRAKSRRPWDSPLTSHPSRWTNTSSCPLYGDFDQGAVHAIDLRFMGSIPYVPVTASQKKWSTLDQSAAPFNESSGSEKSKVDIRQSGRGFADVAGMSRNSGRLSCNDRDIAGIDAKHPGRIMNEIKSWRPRQRSE